MSSAKKIKTAYTFNNKATLIKGGKQYFDQLKSLIGSAQQFIQLQVYIFEDDHTGNEIKECLIAAAKNNINIQVLLDGYASRNLPKEFTQSIRDAGIQLRFFEPILKSKNYYFGRRLHHKMLVVDGMFALVGGINISDRYNDLPNQPSWLDYAVLIEGEAAFELHKLCLQFYHKKRNTETWIDKSNVASHIQTFPHTAIRIRRNDWVMNKNQISGTYMEMFRNAQRSIIMMSSYFIPNGFFRNEMIAALKRGVNIQLILAGKSDVKIAKNAERYFYRWALRNKIQIFEYQPTVLHGKVAICDNRIVTIGSYNINDLSALASVELNADIEDDLFAETVIKEVNDVIMHQTTEIKKIDIDENFGTWDKFIQWLSYITFRSIFKLFTFYFSKKTMTE
ncbi:MAG: phospholipase D-like domain-containing protein [Bacteroidota bacterium]|jgi:cardiolipin synthase